LPHHALRLCCLLSIKSTSGGARANTRACGPCCTQLEAVKAERGGRVEDGAVAPSKPLAEVLREAKEAKEEAFQAMWRQMKTGAGTRLRDLGGRLRLGSACVATGPAP